MRRTAHIVLATCLACYLLFYFLSVRSEKKEDTTLCHGVEVVVLDSLKKHFINQSDIHSLLKREKIDPTGKPMQSLNTEKVEQTLLKNKRISQVKAYKTPSGLMGLVVKQRMPVLRVISHTGSYYVDKDGVIMPTSSRFAIKIPLASGSIEQKLAVGELRDFALFLQEDDFWNSQIEQIFVHPDREVELIPCVGDQRILLGSLEDYQTKLENLKLFYEQAMPKVGWEKYKLINLSYKGQVIGVRK